MELGGDDKSRDCNQLDVGYLAATERQEPVEQVDRDSNGLTSEVELSKRRVVRRIDGEFERWEHTSRYSSMIFFR